MKMSSLEKLCNTVLPFIWQLQKKAIQVHIQDVLLVVDYHPTHPTPALERIRSGQGLNRLRHCGLGQHWASCDGDTEAIRCHSDKLLIHTLSL